MLKFRKTHLKVVLLLFLMIGATLCTSLIIGNKSVFALSGSSFNPGDIIDEGVFTNSNAMSVTQIQNFLNAEVGTCDNNGTRATDHWNSSTNSYYTDGQWATLYSQPSTFTCINQYFENTSTLQNNLGNYTANVPGGISAAQIIYNAAQANGINPEVILATIQKEQGLVTDYWPWLDEYQYAMGYDCPDSTGCTSNDADFYAQVSNAAWQFRDYLNNPDEFNYTVGQDYVQYNPTSSCGGSVINIQDEATAALYDYTPYQPDTAALANVSSSSAGGTGDSCSAYGNRNFWWYFNTWFGPSNPSFYTTYQGQSLYPTLIQGQTTTASIRYENAGNEPWFDDVSAPQYNTYPVHLAVTSPMNSSSPFSATWPSNDRPTGVFEAVYDSDGVTLAPNQHIAEPGDIVVFQFTITAPGNLAAGNYQLNVQPILEGSSLWNMGGIAWWDIEVNN